MKEEFINLIREHENLILKVCNVYCSQTEDREDLYQDILVQLWKAYPRFNQQSKISTWIYRIAFNTAVSRFRKYKNTPSKEPISEQLPDAVPSTKPEDVQQLELAINELNELEKAITLLYMDGCKYREIGEIIGISETNVGFKINRIKKKLFKILNQNQL